MLGWWVAAAFGQDTGAADPAAGGSSAVTFNDDLEIRLWRSVPLLDLPVPDDQQAHLFNYVEQVNRLNVNASAGKWTFAAQVDEVSLWLDRYYLDGELQLERDLTPDDLPNLFPGRFSDTAYVNLEKIRASTSGDWGEITLGDAYVAFGRGMALNLNRNVDIDIDTSVQGAKVVLRPGAWDLTLVAGQANRQQVFQDNPNAPNPVGLSASSEPVLAGDTRHLITGFRAERFGLGPANLGAHVVGYDFVEDPGWEAGFTQLKPFDAVIGGATAEVLGIGGIDTYVEGDVFSFSKDQPSSIGEEASELGYGVYASASAYPGPFVVLVEGKRYYQAERVNGSLTGELYEVAVAPTLEYERVITEDSSAALNSSDIWGGRVQIDWAAVPGKVVPYVACAVFRDLDIGTLQFASVPETVVHPVAGVEWIDGEFAMLLNAGHRHDERDGTDAGSDDHTHVDLTLNVPLPGALTGNVNFYAEDFHWGTNIVQAADYMELESGWTVSYGSEVSATLFVDRSTNPLVLPNSSPNLGENMFLSGELQVKPANAWTLKAFYGSQKSGIRCSGGQCRQLPAFDGARFSVVGTF